MTNRIIKAGLSFLLAGIAATSFGQEHLDARAVSVQCATSKKMNFNNVGKSTVASPLEDLYDVGYVKLDVAVSNANNSISGNATTTGTVVAPSMSQYVFELHPQITIDSVIFNGQSLPVSTSGFVRTVTPGTALPQGSNFTVRVYYHGQPPNNSGIRRQQSQSWGAWVTYTLAQPYEARDWWPCKQSLQDKIDSTDIWITVPNSHKAGSNGLLTAITPIGSTHSRYEWKSRYTIDYYLLSLSASTYIDYSYYMHFSNSNDSMLIQNYIYNNSNTLPFFQDLVDSIGTQVDFFSILYGRYPFWEEKYGHCMAPFAGGMEHQTMTTQGFFESTLNAHELGHQWFGDHVTCGTWKDIWLNEGFASYSEYLFVDSFWGSNAAFDLMHDVHDDVLSEPDGSVYVDDTTDENRIFDGRLTYNKGNSIVHTLRFVCGSDNVFFQLLQDYQALFANSTAITQDLEDLAELATGQNLDTFFQQWIYKEGYPIYNAGWAQAGNSVFVQLAQSTSKPVSVSVFATPLELKLKGPQGDTTVLVYNNQNLQNYTFTWSKPMDDMEIDPNEWLLRKVNSISENPALAVSEIAASDIKVYPNPAKDQWNISGLEGQYSLELRDMSGRLLYRNTALNGDSSIDAASFSSGIYLLSVTDTEGNTHKFKLSKQ